MDCKYSREIIIGQLKSNKTNSQIVGALGCCESIVKALRCELGIEEINYGAKSILQFTKQGDFINSFDSAASAARALSTSDHSPSASNITKCCKGHTKTAYGYVWKYSNLYEFSD